MASELICFAVACDTDFLGFDFSGDFPVVLLFRRLELLLSLLETLGPKSFPLSSDTSLLFVLELLRELGGWLADDYDSMRVNVISEDSPFSELRARRHTNTHFFMRLTQSWLVQLRSWANR